MRLPPLLVLLIVALFSSPISPVYADESCGTTTCTGSKVCCDYFVGTGPQCMDSCPTVNRVHPPATDTSVQTSPVKSSADKSVASKDSGGLVNPLNAGSIPELLDVVLKAVIQIGTIFLVLALVWVGFLFVAAQGKEEKIRDARNALMWTVIGGLVLLGAQAISLAIQATAQAL